MIRTTATCCSLEGNSAVDVLSLMTSSVDTKVYNQSEVSGDLLLSFSSSGNVSVDNCVFSSK